MLGFEAMGTAKPPLGTHHRPAGAGAEMAVRWDMRGQELCLLSHPNRSHAVLSGYDYDVQLSCVYGWHVGAAQHSQFCSANRTLLVLLVHPSRALLPQGPD